MTEILKAELALDACATLGECIRWDARDQLIYWIDIPGRKMHRYDPASGRDDSVGLPQEMGCFAQDERGGFIAGMRSGYSRINQFGGDISLLTSPDYDTAKARFNDGRCDANGRFWAGTMWEPRDKSGAYVYCLEADGRFSAKATPVTLSNGITFSLDSKTFTLADTPNHVLWAFDYDVCDAVVSNRRVLRTFDPPRGRPDGACVDAEGNVYIAIFAGGRVEKISPNGELLAVIELPVPNITCCTFAGDDLQTLYVTTARVRMTDEELAAKAGAGGLFAIRMPSHHTPGILEPRYAG